MIIIHNYLICKSSLCYFTDLMIVHFDSMVFTGSESSGNITISLELIRHPLVNGEISVTIIPSDQSPTSAQGKRSVI